MQSLIQPFNVLLPMLYGMALICYGIYLSNGNEQSGKWAPNILLTALVIHLFYFIARSNFQYFPITNSFDSLSMVAFSIAMIHLIIERTSGEGKTGAFFIFIVFVFQASASMFHVTDIRIHELLTNPIFGIHVFLTLVGISALAISAIYGLIYWMFAKQIKSHNLGIIYRGMPPLDQLESMGRLSSILGLVSLGFGLITGHFYAYRVLGELFPPDLKIIINDAAWIFYLLGWAIVKLKNYSGLRLSKLSFWGFIAFAGVIMAANFISSSFHQFN